jgi:hypothetical protein
MPLASVVIQAARKRHQFGSLSPAFGPFQNGSFGRQLLESGRLFDNAVMALKPTIHHSGRGDNRRLRTRGEVINQHL